MELKKFVREGFTASETAQFEELFGQLQKHFARTLGVGYLLGNINVGQKNLDAILLTNHLLVGIEFKNFGGTVQITSNSWENIAENGTKVIVEGGASGKTPLEQAVINHSQLSSALASYKNLPEKEFLKKGGVPYFIVFNRSVRINDPTGLLKGTPWLRVTDNLCFYLELISINQDIHFADQEVEDFKKHLGLIGESASIDKYELASNLFRMGDYRGALRELDKVGPNAKVSLLRGRCYYQLGNNPSEAVREITKASMAGLPYAKYMLGSFMLNGYSPVLRNRVEAIKLLRESLAGGVTEAKTLLDRIAAEDAQREKVEQERQRQEKMCREREGYSAQVQMLSAFVLLIFACVVCFSFVEMGDTWNRIFIVLGFILISYYIGSCFSSDAVESYEKVGAFLENRFPLRAPILDGRVDMTPVDALEGILYPFASIPLLLPLAGMYLALYYVVDIDWLWFHVNFKYFPFMSLLLKTKGFFLGFAIGLLTWGVASCIRHYNDDNKDFFPRPSWALLGYWFRLSWYGLKVSLGASALIIAGKLIFG